MAWDKAILVICSKIDEIRRSLNDGNGTFEEIRVALLKNVEGTNAAIGVLAHGIQTQITKLEAEARAAAAAANTATNAAAAASQPKPKQVPWLGIAVFAVTIAGSIWTAAWQAGRVPERSDIVELQRRVAPLEMAEQVRIELHRLEKRLTP